MCRLLNTYHLQDIPEEERTALSIVSYIGCGISIICLVITIILLVYFRLVTILVCEYLYVCNYGIYRNTLLKGIHSFIHLNLVIALLLALIVFVSGIETATKSEVSLYTYMYFISWLYLLTYIGWLYSGGCFVALFLYCRIHLDVVWGHHALFPTSQSI